MISKHAAELEAIRETQADLRLKLAALGNRICEMEEQVASATAAGRPADTPLPEPPPPSSSPMSVPPAGPPPKVVPPPLPDVFADVRPEIPVTGLPSEAVSAPPLPSPELPPVPPPPRVAAPDESLEMHLGRVWLVRVGIVILLTGLVFLGNFAWQEVVVKLGAAGKLGLIDLAGFALAGMGAFLLKTREQMRGYANVLTGGGLAVIYYATYAAHFVESLRVISSPLIGGSLLLVLAGGIIWIADRRRWETVATITTARPSIRQPSIPPGALRFSATLSSA